ncbi:MAG: hypothetical protein HZB33_14760 [Nitrospirae bacterium]|nr:hypothetical protein [Nitrospirota bacterium]
MSFADDNPDDQSLTVIFDDAKTGTDAIKEALKKDGFPVSGEPRIIK